NALLRDGVGFAVKVHDQSVVFLRPEPPTFKAWFYSGYDRFMGIASHASGGGLLSNNQHNREILPRRVEEYQEKMAAGEWRDLLSDPITLRRDGQVVNGQHRIAAAFT